MKKTTIITPEINKYAPSEKQIKWAHKIIQLDKDYKLEQYKNTLLTCHCCQTSQAVKETTILFSYYYVEPHGCTGGDYYNKDKNARYICNHCNISPTLPENFPQTISLYRNEKHRANDVAGLSDTRF